MHLKLYIQKTQNLRDSVFTVQRFIHPFETHFRQPASLHG